MLFLLSIRDKWGHIFHRMNTLTKDISLMYATKQKKKKNKHEQLLKRMWLKNWVTGQPKHSIKNNKDKTIHKKYLE